MIASWKGGVGLPAIGGDYFKNGRMKVKAKPPDPDELEKQQKIQDFLNHRSNLQHHLYLRELERLYQHHVTHRIPQLQWQRHRATRV
jgi:hypothetical protein